MDEKLIRLLKSGGVAVIPTDTIYGIVGSALNPDVVERIYKLRKRSTNKPFIILISSIKDLSIFNIKITKKQKDFLQKNWPNPISVILPCPQEKFAYLHKGTNSLAFRIPKGEALLKFLGQTGPLVAPSANHEEEKEAETIEEAKRYFRNEVSFYQDGGIIKSEPSTLIELNFEGSYRILRQGVFKIG